MSCFIVSPQTIHRVVEAAASAERYIDHERPYAKPFEALGYNLNQTSERQRLARDLFENNVAAFCDRYPPFEDAPESATTRYPEDIPPFSVVIPPAGKQLSRDQLIQAHKSAACLHYQSCEGDIANAPLTKALEEFCRLLAEDVLVQSEEWQAANWG